MSATFWILNNVPTPALAVGVVGGLMAFAALGLVLVRRRWPDLTAGEHNDVAGVLLGVVGAVYGILLAFVIVAVYTSFTDAGLNVRTEASAVSQIYHDTRGLDVAAPMADRVRDYVHDVVEDEWPLMATGGSSQRVEDDLSAMFETLQGTDPHGEGQIGFYRAAIDDLGAVIASRRARLFDAQQELPGILGVLLYGGAILLVAFTWLFGMRRFRTQLVMVLGVAGLVGFSLLVALVIDHPFSGDVVVTSAPFRQGVLARFW